MGMVKNKSELKLPKQQLSKTVLALSIIFLCVLAIVITPSFAQNTSDKKLCEDWETLKVVGDEIVCIPSEVEKRCSNGSYWGLNNQGDFTCRDKKTNELIDSPADINSNTESTSDIKQISDVKQASEKTLESNPSKLSSSNSIIDVIIGVPLFMLIIIAIWAAYKSRKNKKISKFTPSTNTDKKILYVIDTNVIYTSLRPNKDFHEYAKRFLFDQIRRKRLYVSKTVEREMEYHIKMGRISKEQFKQSHVGKYWADEKNRKYVKISNKIEKEFLRSLKSRVKVESQEELSKLDVRSEYHDVVSKFNAHKMITVMINMKFKSIWNDPTKADKIKNYVTKKRTQTSKEEPDLSNPEYEVNDKKIFADAVLLNISYPEHQIDLVSFDTDLFTFSEELEVFGITVRNGFELESINDHGILNW